MVPNHARYHLRYTPNQHYGIIMLLWDNVKKKISKSRKMLRVILNAEKTDTAFSALFLSKCRRKEVKTLNGYSYLTLEQRREIEKLYAEGERVVDIAAHMQRSTAAIYEELKRGYTGELDGYARPEYSAELAQATVQANFRRRGNRRSVKFRISEHFTGDAVPDRERH